MGTQRDNHASSAFAKLYNSEYNSTIDLWSEAYNLHTSL